MNTIKYDGVEYPDLQTKGFAAPHTSGWDAEPNDEEEYGRGNYLNPEFTQRHAQ